MGLTTQKPVVSEGLTRGEEFIVKWQYRMSGGFFAALATAISLADTENRERLSQGFPHEVEGYRHYIGTPGWWDATEDKARKAGWHI